MIIEEFKKYNLNDFKEIVFCGFGEPIPIIERGVLSQTCYRRPNPEKRQIL